MTALEQPQPPSIYLVNKAAHDYFDRISDLRPREIAIIGVSLIESGLRYLLLGNLVGGSSKLFEDDRALTSLSARAQVARSMGLISKKVLSEVITLGRIRNQFAHRYEIDTFDENIVAEISKDLRLFTKKDAADQCLLLLKRKVIISDEPSAKNIFVITDEVGFALFAIDFAEDDMAVTPQVKFINSIKSTWAVIVLAACPEMMPPQRGQDLAKPNT